MKIIHQSNGDIIEHEWCKNDNGILCQTMMQSGELVCLDDTDFQVACAGRTLLNARSPDASVTSFELQEGSLQQ